MSENSSNNKRIAKNTLLLYLRMFVIMATQLYTSRVVLSTLGVVDYGIYNVVGGVVAMFGFLNSAMATATQRFLTFELGKKNFEGQIKIFNTSIQIHLLLAIIILLLAETVGLWFLNHKMIIPIDRMAAAHWVFHCSIISSLIVVMSVPFNASLIAHERMSAFAYISIIEVFLKLAIVFILMVLDIDKLKLYAILLLAVQTIIILIYNSYCVKHFEEIQFRGQFDKGYFKKMISFAGWNILGVGANLCCGQGVNILLNVFFGPAVNAARAVAMQVMNAISQFSSNFMMAVNPQITKSYAINNKDYLFDLLFKSSRVTFFLMSLLVIPLLMEGPFVLALWLKNVPEYTVHFFRISLIIAVFDAISLPLSQAIGATGQLKYYQITVGGLLLLILPISYVFLKSGGSPLVVYFVHLVVAISAFIARLLFVQKMIGLDLKAYITNVVYRSLSIVIISCPAIFFLHAVIDDTILNHFIFLIATCLLILIATILAGVSKAERQMITQLIKDKLGHRG